MAAARAAYGIVPPSPPLPTAWNLRFHPDAGSQTSTRMSESGVGVSLIATRQNAGRFLYAAAAFGLFAFGGTNALACTDSADRTVPFATGVCARASHDAGAAARTRNSPSDPASATTATKAITDPIRISQLRKSLPRNTARTAGRSSPRRTLS